MSTVLDASLVAWLNIEDYTRTGRDRFAVGVADSLAVEIALQDMADEGWYQRERITDGATLTLKRYRVNPASWSWEIAWDNTVHGSPWTHPELHDWCTFSTSAEAVAYVRSLIHHPAPTH